jgi:hypothetical protein
MIKVGICAAYDWYLLKNSLPLVYPFSDKICISIDKDRISWAGNKYEINNEEFYAYIKTIDQQQKITIYEDDFHLPNLTSMQNEVRQRNLIAEKLGKGGWHIQIDTDEYFINFKGLVDFLKINKFRQNINISCPFIILYKKNKEGFFVVKEENFSNYEFIDLVTNNPNYEYGRRNGNFNYYTDFFILHQSWARSEDEIRLKINNWGHNKDFDTTIYFEKWRNLELENYRDYTNFHPVIPKIWQSLEYVKAQNIEELLLFYKQKKLPISPFKLKLKNSINYSRLSKIFPFLRIK